MFLNRLQALSFNSQSRNYIGASQLGEGCDRKLWLEKNDPIVHKYNYRIKDILDRGFLEENRILNYIQQCNFRILDTQVYIKSGYLQGNVDAIIQDNESQHKYVLEIKTMNHKNFQSWTKKGCQITHFKYFTQVQCYMGMLELPQTLLVVRNKNDETIAEEIIDFDKDFFLAQLAKVERLELARKPPLGYTASGKKHFSCQWCQYQEKCWGSFNNHL